jgi:hypothetical protein
MCRVEKSHEAVRRLSQRFLSIGGSIVFCWNKRGEQNIGTAATNVNIRDKLGTNLSPGSKEKEKEKERTKCKSESRFDEKMKTVS